MKKYFIPIIIVIVAATYLLLRSFHSDLTDKNPLTPNIWMHQQRVYPYQFLPKDYQSSALAYIDKNQKSINVRNERTWVNVGPSNIGGRITDIEVVQDDSMHLVIGTASGGVFESMDGGKVWLPVFDDNPSLSIGDIAISSSHPNIWYVGTGEPNSGGGSVTYDGTGIYKTMDGGKNWSSVGEVKTGSVAKIQIHPSNPNIVYAAFMGALFANDTLRGVYRSMDGGQNWARVLYLSDSTGAIDLIMDPLHPDTLYAAMWERIRRHDRISYGGHTSGIYKSTDGGETWHELTNGLPKQRFEKGRIGLALCATQPNVLYAFYAKRDGNFRGIFKSTDYGETWQVTGDPRYRNYNYFWWFGNIFIDPSDPDIVYCSGLYMKKTLDGGKTWTDIFTKAHVDHHALYIHPDNGQWVLNGNDGGLYKSIDGGSKSNKLQGLPITQFYTCEVDPIQPNLHYGGTQDNSTMRGQQGEAWEVIYRGDGFYTLVDPVDNEIIYTEYQYGRLAKSINNGLIFKFATNGIKGTDRKNWNTPVVFDPENSTIMYFGSHRLYKSTNAAETWQIISPNLTGGLYEGNNRLGTITTISVSPLNSKIIYVGTDDGRIQFTEDGGNNWKLVNDGLPNRWVTRVVCDAFDDNTVYICFSGYRNNDFIAHVYKSEDKGASWENIGQSLPDIPVNDILIHPETDEIFIATDIGVFSALNGSWNWQRMSDGMPNVVVSDLDLDEMNNRLLAASFGRSMYITDLDQITTGITVNSPTDFKAYPNPFISSFRISSKSATTSALLQLIIRDVSGNVMYNGDYRLEDEMRLNLTPGVYIAELMKDKIRIGTFKIMRL